MNFENPPNDYRPETWFHLIGGNVSKAGLTVDLEAVAGAGLKGIQLFHGRGGEWPEVAPQIQCLSPSWDDMIAHVGQETDRLGLNFTMQNCPGWAMSGGPWITPDKAMRHLIWSRLDVEGGSRIHTHLPEPQPSEEDWRDYREVAVLAFPTPLDDSASFLSPSSVRSNREELPWMDLIQGVEGTVIQIEPSEESVWVEVSFAEAVSIRSIELPNTENLMMRRIFDPESSIRIEALEAGNITEVGYRRIPRGTWQDRQEDIDLVLACSDHRAMTFRITFETENPMELSKLRLSAAARLNDWRGQAGYALRSLERTQVPEQNPESWIESKSIIDVSKHMDAGGNLDWKVPAGEWTIVRFGHVNTGIKNKPAPPEATGFECDKLSPLGANQHFAGYIGRLTKSGGAVEGLLDGMLIDSWECYTQTWTPSMEKEFKKRRGYKLRRWLPALAGWVVDDHSTSERFLRDWRCTISDLLVDNYFGRLGELAHERGLKFSFETALGDVSPGDILQYYGKADIPMCEFWHPNDPHWGGFETKMIHPTVSAAHLYGKPVIAAEAFTNVGIRWDEHPWMLKHQADRHFALGVNHMIFHTYTHNPRQDVVPGTSFGSRIGTPFLRGQTWWKYMPLFTDYLARCQYLLQQGKPVADVLWYLGDDLDHKPRQDTPFPSGYQFDYLNQDVLLNRLDVNDGLLQTPEGITWKVLWMPEEQCQRLTPTTLARILELLKEGAIIICKPPEMNASLSGGRSAKILFETLEFMLWGKNPSEKGERKIGKGQLLWGADLSSILKTLGIAPDLDGTRGATWCHRRTEEEDIYFISAARLSPLEANVRFRCTGRPMLLDPLTGVSNPVEIYHRDGDHTIIPLSVDAAGSVFVVFTPGEKAPVYTGFVHDGNAVVDSTDPGRRDTSVPYPNFGLEENEETQPWVDPLPVNSRLLSGGRQLLAWKPGHYRLVRSDGEILETDVEGPGRKVLDGGWSLAFPPGWNTPEKVFLDAPLPWSDLADPAIRAFSGTAIYETSLELENIDSATRLMLDLGHVSNIAEVLVNDVSVATLWTSPFRVDVTKNLKPGHNKIAIRVTNTWRNRLAYDAALPEAERKTWTIHAPQPGVPVIPAGLDGQVDLWTGQVIPIEDF